MSIVVGIRTHPQHKVIAVMHFHGTAVYRPDVHFPMLRQIDIAMHCTAVLTKLAAIYACNLCTTRFELHDQLKNTLYHHPTE
jgi:hypothetical protein